MAPEICEHKIYDGRQTDIFSMGVILFTLVLGIYPFFEPNTEDKFYSLLISKKYDKYWQKVGGESLSKDLKDLI